MPDHKRLADMTLKEREDWTREQQKILLEEDRKKDKKWKLGMIEQSGYLCLGDTYVEPGKAFDDSSRTKGLNMKVPGIKLGRSEDKGKYFSQQTPICVGDPFMSNQDRKLVERKKGREIDERNRIAAYQQARARAGSGRVLAGRAGASQRRADGRPA